MLKEYKTFSGISVIIDEIGRTGYGLGDKVTWTIFPEIRLSDEDVEEIIELYYPYAGYGPSSWFTKPSGKIVVTSSASCE